MNNIVKKFQYTTGDLFTLTGSNYNGYFNVLDGAAYLGKYEQKVPLQNKETARNVFTLSNKFYNRLPTQNVTLTYALSDFIFQSNEYINNNSLNVKLEKAFVNFLDSFGGCFMASSKLPYALTKTAVLSNTNMSTQFVWVTGTQPSTYIQSPSSVLNSTSNLALFQNTYSTNNTLVITNSSTLFTYKVNPTANTFNLVFSSNRIDTTDLVGYGSIDYGYISDMSKVGSNLYVTDIGRRKIYKYDVKSVLDEDRALGYKFNLVQTIDDTQAGFYQPALIESSDKNVFVYDSSNYVIYFYNDTFTLINTYKNSKLFSVSTPVCMTYYKIYDQLYILTADFKIVILDKNTNSTILQLDTRGIQQDEQARTLIFSNSYSDVFYVLSNRSLYKKFVSNPLGNIGTYSFVANITGYNVSTIGNVLFDIATYDSNLRYDNLIVYGYDQLINYNEVTTFNSLIK